MVGLVAGLFGRHWLVGYASGILLALAGLSVVWEVTDFQFSAFRSLPWFWRACHIPATMLVAILPLLGLRYFRHWRVSHPVTRKLATHIEDILLTTTIVGSVLVLMVTPSIVTRAQDSLATRFDYFMDHSRLMHDELRFAGWGAFSLIVIAPMVAFALDRRGSLLRKTLLLLVHAMISLALGIGILVLLGEPVGNAPTIATGLAVAYLMVSIGLIAVRASGLQLHSRISDRHTPSDSQADVAVQPLVNPHPHRMVWPPRVLSGLLMTVAIYASVTAASISRNAEKTIEQFSALKSEMRAAGGSIDGHTFPAAGNVVFGAEMGDQWLDKLRGSRNMDSISLAGSQVTDAGMSKIANFPYISELDLSRTSITDDGLANLPQFYDGLSSLNLAGSHVTMAGINKLLARSDVNLLNLSDLNLTDEDISQLKLRRRSTLVVTGNPLTDASLENLFQYRGVGLGRNNFGDDWASKIQQCSERLILSGADMTDGVLAKITDHTTFFDYLIIENTAITDAGLAALSGVTINSLEIGPGLITDDGLAKAKLRVTSQLKLSGSVTGACLKDWPISSLQVLDLSYSQVTDDVLAAITLPRSLARLGLASTAISDAGVQAIRRSRIQMCNLLGTSVTADSIVGARNLGYVLLEAGKLSAEEIQTVKRQGREIVETIGPVRVLDRARRSDPNAPPAPEFEGQ